MLCDSGASFLFRALVDTFNLSQQSTVLEIGQIFDEIDFNYNSYGTPFLLTADIDMTGYNYQPFTKKFFTLAYTFNHIDLVQKNYLITFLDNLCRISENIFFTLSNDDYCNRKWWIDQMNHRNYRFKPNLIHRFKEKVKDNGKCDYLLKLPFSKILIFKPIHFTGRDCSWNLI